MYIRVPLQRPSFGERTFYSTFTVTRKSARTVTRECRCETGTRGNMCGLLHTGLGEGERESGGSHRGAGREVGDDPTPCATVGVIGKDARPRRVASARRTTFFLALAFDRHVDKGSYREPLLAGSGITGPWKKLPRFQRHSNQRRRCVP